MGEVTREEGAAMTDQELLAYEREHAGVGTSAAMVGLCVISNPSSGLPTPPVLLRVYCAETAKAR